VLPFLQGNFLSGGVGARLPDVRQRCLPFQCQTAPMFLEASVVGEMIS
jgi:hypothetical protein